MTYSIKGLKTWRTDDGGGYQLTLLRDGKPVAEVTNDGNGGCFNFRWTPPHVAAEVTALDHKDEEHKYMGCAEEALLWDACRAVPPYEAYGMMMRSSPDVFVEELVNDFNLEKSVKRMLKKTTVVDGKDVWQWTGVLDDRMRAHLKGKYPNGVLLNDLPLVDAIAIVRKLQ